MNKVKVCHLTSAHPRFDVRIFHKECSSLAKVYDVSLVVADGEANAVVSGISIIDVGRPNGRMERFTKTPSKVLAAALEIDADVYHLHDPELMQIALKIKRKGKLVIFDAHEDLPKQILSKPYLSKISARLISGAVKRYEKYICRRLTAIITATPFITSKFKSINPKSFTINNFPLLGELFSESIEWHHRKDHVCYVGGLSKIRGAVEMIDGLAASKRVGVILHVAGELSEEETKTRVSASDGVNKVKFLGQISRDEVRELLASSKGGVVTFLPVPNHIDAQPNKMFEYMSAGIPVIASNFKLWREIIEGNDCGICVDVSHPEEIGKAIDQLLDDDQLAKQLGANGRRAVMTKYNWSIEEKNLLDLYSDLVKTLPQHQATSKL